MNVDANANLIWNRTVLPTLYGKHERADGEKWLVTGVFGLGVKGMEVPADWRSRWESVNDLGKHIPEALRRRVGLA